MLKGTVLITGVNGLIGSQLAATLEECCPDVALVGVDRVTGNDRRKTVQLDLLDKDAVAGLLEKTRPDYLFHMAGVLNSRNWQDLYTGNVATTVNLLEAIAGSSYRTRVVVPGSAAEYGLIDTTNLPITEDQLPNPVSAYGVAKVWQTTAARYFATRNVDVVIGRLFNVIGLGMPESLSVGAFVAQLRKIRDREIPSDIKVGNLKPKRDFLDTRDICRAFVALAVNGVCGEIYNICSGGSVSIEFILHELIRLSGIDARIMVDQARINPADIEDIYGTNDKICRATGWSPQHSIDESLSRIVMAI